MRRETRNAYSIGELLTTSVLVKKRIVCAQIIFIARAHKMFCRKLLRNMAAEIASRAERGGWWWGVFIRSISELKIVCFPLPLCLNSLMSRWGYNSVIQLHSTSRYQVA
jgi:hypothetical protein